MINSIIERAKERFNSKFEDSAGLWYLPQIEKDHIKQNDVIQDFLETEIRAAVREVLEEVKEIVDLADTRKIALTKINEILNEKE